MKFTSWLRALFVFAALLQGCAVAPLSNHVTARTNGAGNSLLSAGSTIGVGRTPWVPSLKYSIGLSENLDLGFQYEVIEYGAFLKYALINNQEEGISLAGLVGTGLSFEGFYGFIGPIVSYRVGIFEPYLLTRFNYVRYPKKEFDIASTGEVKVEPGTYRYFQHTAGFLIWPMEWFGFGLEASAFGTVSSPFILRDKDRFLLSGNFSFRF